MAFTSRKSLTLMAFLKISFRRVFCKVTGVPPPHELGRLGGDWAHPLGDSATPARDVRLGTKLFRSRAGNCASAPGPLLCLSARMTHTLPLSIEIITREPILCR